MENHIKDFVNDHYMSFNVLDLILRIIGYFVFNFIMIFPTEFIITDVQTNGFVNISLSADYAYPLVIGAIIFSITMSIFTIIFFLSRTKWSVIIIRGISFGYISLLLLGLSCFSDFDKSIFDIIVVIIKIFVYIGCIYIYVRYLFKKKLPNFDSRINSHSKDTPIIYLSSLLIIIIEPLISLFLNDMHFTLSLYPLITGGEYFIAVCLIVNTVDLFTKAYYAKKYSL